MDEPTANFNTNSVQKDSRTYPFLIFFLFIFAIIIVVFIVIYNLPSSKDYGEWVPVEYSTCTIPGGTIQETFCKDPGEQVIVEECRLNPKTGKGCLNEGVEVKARARRTILKECTPPCRASLWDRKESSCTLVTDDGIELPPNVCYVSGKGGGIRRVNRTCTVHDTRIDDEGNRVPTGINNCLEFETTEINIPTGGVVSYTSLVNQEIGKKEFIEEGCVDIPNPSCGVWQSVSTILNPDDFGKTLPVYNTSIGPCGKLEDINVDFYFNCATEDAETYEESLEKSQSPFNFLREGYTLTPASCLLPEEKTFYTPALTDSELDLCPSLTYGTLKEDNCTSSPITASAVQNSTLSRNQTRLLCPKSEANPLSNPLCMRLCRKIGVENFPTSQNNVNSDFNFLLNTISIISVSNHFLVPLQIPNNDGKLIALRNSSAPNDYENVPLMFVPNSMLKDTTQCPIQISKYFSALLTFFAPRSITSFNSLKCILMGVIVGSLEGWLMQKDNNLEWNYARQNYEAEGINSNEADQYEITLNSPFKSGSLVDFPGSMSGSMRVSIRSSNGNDLSIPIYNSSNRLSLNDCLLSIFPGVNEISSFTGVPEDCSIFQLTPFD